MNCMYNIIVLREREKRGQKNEGELELEMEDGKIEIRYRYVYNENGLCDSSVCWVFLNYIQTLSMNVINNAKKMAHFLSILTIVLFLVLPNCKALEGEDIKGRKDRLE